MSNEYKRIVLLKGLEPISTHYFSLFKSLLASDLKLERHMQEQYTKVQIADMMEDEFPDDAGLDKLIKFCEDLPALRKRAEVLKKERIEVTGGTRREINRPEPGPSSTASHMLAPGEWETSTAQAETSTAQKRKSMSKGKTGVKKMKASERPDLPPCPEEATAKWQSTIPQITSLASPNIPLAKNTQTQNQTIPRGTGLQTESLTVMVLKATDPFEYGPAGPGAKTMFHATVATADQYFHVKVFNSNLKEMFRKNNFITISNYLKRKDILEINEASLVLEAPPDKKITVPNKLITCANKPNICDIKKGNAGALFYGVFTLNKKNVCSEKTIYELKDDTGNIEVVGTGKWHNVNCKEGDKVQLFCFQLKTIGGQKKLVCGEHSFIKVTKARKKKEAVTDHPSTKKEEETHYPKDQFNAIKVEKQNDFF